MLSNVSMRNPLFGELHLLFWLNVGCMSNCLITQLFHSWYHFLCLARSRPANSLLIKFIEGMYCMCTILHSNGIIYFGRFSVYFLFFCQQIFLTQIFSLFHNFHVHSLYRHSMMARFAAKILYSGIKCCPWMRAGHFMNSTRLMFLISTHLSCSVKL